MGQKGINNIKENMVESSEEVMINRARWVQRLTGIKRYQRRMKNAFDKKVRLHEFSEGDLVWKKVSHV